MINFNGRKTRGIALIAGGAVASLALAPAPATAQTDNKKEKTYKTGAAVLGAASALLILKGETLAGAAAGAGAYYAYKKGQEIKQEREQYPNYDVYSQYPGGYNYPDNYGTTSYPANTYPEYSTYPDYRAPDDYRAPGDVYASYPGGYGGYGAPAYVAPRRQDGSRQNARAPQSDSDVRLK